MIVIGGKAYELITDHKNGWNQEVFRERYSEVLERYDYVVGDWGYNQLRLRGFFKDTNPKATKESAISSIQDYLNEYCNFGCAYFVVERLPGKNVAGEDEAESSAADADLAAQDDSAAEADDMSAYTHRAEAMKQSQPPLRTHMRPQHRPRSSQANTSQLNAQGAGAAYGSQQSSRPQQGGGSGQPQGKQQHKQHGGPSAQPAQQQPGKSQQGLSNQNRNKPHHGGQNGPKQQPRAQHANARQASPTGQAPTNRHH